MSINGTWTPYNYDLAHVRLGGSVYSLGVSLLAAAALLQPVTIDYPRSGTVFPPEFTAPTVLWHDAAGSEWTVEVRFGDGGKPVRLAKAGAPFVVGEIDPRAIAPTNVLPQPPAGTIAWTPNAETWTAIKRHSVKAPATLVVTGTRNGRPVSSGTVEISTSRDPVGAPVFYRDVPLMPSATQKGVIKPLAPSALPLIAWRLRELAQPRSRVLMEGLHTCANCHSFSRDGKTLGMDVDGPQNEKGLYALAPVARHTSIRNEDVIAWSTFQGKLGGHLRVGFMSQVSPDGESVVTTINDPGPEDRRRTGDIQGNYYVANYPDYRFLQVFYPTRGILAWYNKRTGKLQPLPGADDPRYVQTNPVWSPDGKYLVFCRAQAKDAYPDGARIADHANHPDETPIQYDLYRIPFNGGAGGTAEPIAGASANGRSNSFPRVSPDGRWIVYVQARNGLLMRPDSELYIVPFNGGPARRMTANTPSMNSWHSFSPNGRWLVFASKGRSPYTQMYLTHIDADGTDSPAVLVENATAANRAVNLPEFVNIGPGELERIDSPAMDFYRAFNVARDLSAQGKHAEALAAWTDALQLGPDDARVRNHLGAELLELGRTEEAMARFTEALQLDPEIHEAETNLGIALAASGRPLLAVPHFERALLLYPADASARSNLGGALAELGRLDEAVAHLTRALEQDPGDVDAHNNLGIALMKKGLADDAIPHLEAAAEGRPDSFPLQYNLGRVLAARGRFWEAVPHLERAAAGGEPEVVASLAALYARVGRRVEARETAQRALELAAHGNRQDLADAIRKWLESGL